VSMRGISGPSLPFVCFWVDRFSSFLSVHFFNARARRGEARGPVWDLNDAPTRPNPPSRPQDPRPRTTPGPR
jgi:hypothetical protein